MNENIGLKIKELRKEKKLTQSQLAKLINKSTITIRKWENGERTPNIATIKQIASVLNVNINDLISDSILNLSGLTGHKLEFFKGFENEKESFLKELAYMEYKRLKDAEKKITLLSPILELYGVKIKPFYKDEKDGGIYIPIEIKKEEGKDYIPLKIKNEDFCEDLNLIDFDDFINRILFGIKKEIEYMCVYIANSRNNNIK